MLWPCSTNTQYTILLVYVLYAGNNFRIAIMSRSSLIQIINKTDSNAELEHHFYKEENPSC
ncbi:hypothetical protein DERP_014088 [Dermatophagoides pteronyssinus]|uniref:Uncharacterized protein n=1 Tax=Dermatophagoides pteronyssinus TaxID=6956 RepID=A0ABQ8J6E3_DERPT|nr:hypothetical protein DERP_014088 [Dermatophagoides pteronyssinus]